MRWIALALCLMLGLPFQSADAAEKRHAQSARAGAKAKAKARPVAARAKASHQARSAALPLHADGHGLKSNVALVIDNSTGKAVLSKNIHEVQPIASITKLMTALVVLDGNQPLSRRIAITDEDIDTERGSRSRLKVGTELSRNELLHLALMASENRAAHALGRSHPGGLAAFVEAMNQKARELGMQNTRFVDPTGLSSANVSTAADLARLVEAAHRVHLIRQYSTDPSYEVNVQGRDVAFHNTNRLVAASGWDIGLSKTGFINEAGRCLVMLAKIDGRPLTFVLLDSWGKLSRIGDANRIRKWLTTALPSQPTS